MVRNPIHRAGSHEAENSGGVVAGLFADEDDFDRRALLRLACWGAVAVSAVAVALYTNQASIGLHHVQVAAADLARQEQQIQSIAREGQNETRRLASAIDTLNTDRDRLYSRVTVLEQGLDSVTGSIARQKAVIAEAPPQPAPAPVAVATGAPAAPSNPAPARVAPAATAMAAAEKPVADASPPRPSPAVPASAEPATPNKADAPAATPAAPATTAKSIVAPPDAAAEKPATPELPAKTAAAPAPTPPPAVVAAVPAADKPDAAEAEAAPSTPPKVAVQKTEFAVDVGGANSVGGLRALWRGLLKSRSNAPLAALHPIIMIKESSSGGGGMQLRLGAGPLSDAAAAAKICAVMVENHRPCETTVYDGQRLAMAAEDASASTAAAKPDSARPSPHRRGYGKRVTAEEPPPPPPEPTTLSTIFGRR